MGKFWFIQCDLTSDGIDPSGVDYRRIFQRLAGCVKEYNVDLMFVTGFNDLNQTGRDALRRFGEEIMRQETQLKIFLLLDGLKADTGLDSGQWPGNFQFLTEFETVMVEELDLLVHGGFINDGMGQPDPLPGLAWLSSAFLNFLILPEKFPIDGRRLIKASSRFDYCSRPSRLSSPGRCLIGSWEGKKVLLKNLPDPGSDRRIPVGML